MPRSHDSGEWDFVPRQNSESYDGDKNMLDITGVNNEKSENFSQQPQTSTKEILYRTADTPKDNSHHTSNESINLDEAYANPILGGRNYDANNLDLSGDDTSSSGTPDDMEIIDRDEFSSAYFQIEHKSNLKNPQVHKYESDQNEKGVASNKSEKVKILYPQTNVEVVHYHVESQAPRKFTLEIEDTRSTLYPNSNERPDVEESNKLSASSILSTPSPSTLASNEFIATGIKSSLKESVNEGRKPIEEDDQSLSNDISGSNIDRSKTEINLDSNVDLDLDDLDPDLDPEFNLDVQEDNEDSDFDFDIDINLAQVQDGEQVSRSIELDDFNSDIEEELADSDMSYEFQESQENSHVSRSSSSSLYSQSNGEQTESRTAQQQQVQAQNTTSLVFERLDRVNICIDIISKLCNYLQFQNGFSLRNIRTAVVVLTALGIGMGTIERPSMNVVDRSNSNRTVNSTSERVAPSPTPKSEAENFELHLNERQLYNLKRLQNDLIDCAHDNKKHKSKKINFNRKKSNLTNYNIKSDTQDEFRICTGHERFWLSRFESLSNDYDLNIRKILSRIQNQQQRKFMHLLRENFVTVRLISDHKQKHIQKETLNLEYLALQLDHLDKQERERKEKHLRAQVNHLREENRELYKKLRHPQTSDHEQMIISNEIQLSKLKRENILLRDKLAKKTGSIFVEQEKDLEYLEQENELLRQFIETSLINLAQNTTNSLTGQNVKLVQRNRHSLADDNRANLSHLRHQLHMIEDKILHLATQNTARTQIAESKVIEAKNETFICRHQLRDCLSTSLWVDSIRNATDKSSCIDIVPTNSSSSLNVNSQNLQSERNSSLLEEYNSKKNHQPQNNNIKKKRILEHVVKEGDLIDLIAFVVADAAPAFSLIVGELRQLLNEIPDNDQHNRDHIPSLSKFQLHTKNQDNFAINNDDDLNGYQYDYLNHLNTNSFSDVFNFANKLNYDDLNFNLASLLDPLLGSSSSRLPISSDSFDAFNDRVSSWIRSELKKSENVNKFNPVSKKNQKSNSTSRLEKIHIAPRKSLDEKLKVASQVVARVANNSVAILPKQQGKLLSSLSSSSSLIGPLKKLNSLSRLSHQKSVEETKFKISSKENYFSKEIEQFKGLETMKSLDRRHNRVQSDLPYLGLENFDLKHNVDSDGPDKYRDQQFARMKRNHRRIGSNQLHQQVHELAETLVETAVRMIEGPQDDLSFSRESGHLQDQSKLQKQELWIFERARQRSQLRKTMKKHKNVIESALTDWIYKRARGRESLRYLKSSKFYKPKTGPNRKRPTPLTDWIERRSRGRQNLRRLNRDREYTFKHNNRKNDKEKLYQPQREARRRFY